MSKLKKCLDREDALDKKIAELMSQKADLEVARKQEEDKEIVRTLRELKLEKHELQRLLAGIRKGEVQLVRNDEDPGEAEDGSTDIEDAEHAPEDESTGSFRLIDPESEVAYGGQTYE